MDKMCSSCSETKDVSMFQKRSMSKDGLTAACKKCLSARDKSRDSQERRKARYAYAKTERGIETRRRGRKAWEERNPDKRACHVITGNAIRRGRITNGPCSICCSTTNIEAHHNDYAKPLDVIWLCRQCHADHHK